MTKVKYLLLITGCAGVLTLSACGNNSYSGSMDYSKSAAYDADTNAVEMYDGIDSGVEGSYDDTYEAESVTEESADESEGAEDSRIDAADNTPGVDSKKITRDKLVYTCDLSIDTLDFEASIKTLTGLIEKNEGFVETEEYSDGSSYDYYNYTYVDDSSKHNRYTATIRIPSKKYEDFLDDAADLGDVRSRNARVDNVSQEYTDLNTTLEVYEAAYDRYMKLLSETTDDEYALKLQQEITDTQIEIARIKTRLNKIDTDVLYSFVNISIREVSKYDAKPLPKDTFTQRLVSEIEDTFYGFLDFLEGLLFLIIHMLPYAALIGIIIVIVRYIRKKMGKLPLMEVWRTKREKRKLARAKAIMKKNQNDDQSDKGGDQ